MHCIVMNSQDAPGPTSPKPRGYRPRQLRVMFLYIYVGVCVCVCSIQNMHHVCRYYFVARPRPQACELESEGDGSSFM
jgi:hypothetical protein